MLFVTLMKLPVSYFPFAACRDEPERGAIHEKCGQRVGGRRGVHNVSSECAAVLIGNSAGPRRGGSQERKLASHDVVPPQVGICTAGTDASFVGQDLDLPEFRKIPDADQPTCGKLSGGI